MERLIPACRLGSSGSPPFPDRPDLAPPALGTLNIVNSGNPKAGTPGFVADLDTITEGGQMNLSITFSGAGSIDSSLATAGSIAITATSLPSGSVLGAQDVSGNG